MIIHHIPPDHPEPDPADLQRQLDALDARIKDGERRIAEAREVGADVTEWEAFWTDLLATYEEIHARLATLSGEGE